VLFKQFVLFHNFCLEVRHLKLKKKNIKIILKNYLLSRGFEPEPPFS
jgi:hypothetical protein